MKKHNIWFTSLLLVIWHTQAISQKSPCPVVFSPRENRFLYLAARAEELTHKINNMFLIKINEDITQLQLTIDQQISTIFEKNGHSSRRSLITLKRDIESLESILNEAHSLLNGKTVSHKIVTDIDPTLVNLIKNPDIIRANKAYRIDWLHNPQSFYVIFDRMIIDSFFHTKKDSKNRLIVAKKNLKALQRGYTKGHNESGIKLLTLSGKGHTSNHPNYYGNKMFEVKTIGKFSGHIRWGGFIDGNTLYVVHYSKNTHGGKHKHVFIMTLWNKLQNFHSFDHGQLSYRH